VIGAMLVTDRAVQAVLTESGLRPEHFYRESSREIFSLIREMAGRDEGIDVVTVAAELKKRNSAITSGQLVEMAASVPAAGNALHYARPVIHTADLRAKLVAAQRMQQAVYDDDEAAMQRGIEQIVAIAEQPSFGPATRAPVNGHDFIMGVSEDTPSIWGSDKSVLWAAGEPLMVAAPTGVGKTTLTGRLALHRAGVLEGPLLGLPVEVGVGRGLYFAMDRPRQIARSFRRQVTHAESGALAKSLLFWEGPLPFSVSNCQRGDLLALARSFPEVDTIYIDSLKDLAVGLNDDVAAANVNTELQLCSANGLELVVNHHQRKANEGNKTPRDISDVYGNQQLTSGMGSVLLLWGQPGDAIIEMRHLKQPADEVGPLNLEVDPDRGDMTLHKASDIYAVVSAAPDGLSAPDVAQALFGSAGKNEVEKARRKLDKDPRFTCVAATRPQRYVAVRETVA
jgi:replicative DNA helicase